MPTRLGDLVHFHVPKTGGSSVLAAMTGAGGERLGNGHDLWTQWRHEVEGLRCFATIRDPWSRYASFWLHALRVNKYAGLEAWGGGSMRFRDVLYGWTHVEANRVSRETAVIWHPGAAHKLVASGLGLYSWEVQRMCGGRMDAWVATDRLHEGLLEIGVGGPEVVKNNAGPRCDYSVRRLLAELGAPPEVANGEYRGLYDDEALEWVAESEAELIERFGWAPWEASPRALYAGGPTAPA